MFIVNENKDFIKKWESRRKFGRNNYIIKGTVVGALIILILLVMKDFYVHPIPFNLKELGNLIFKNIFISIILAAFASLQSWNWQDRKYENIKKEKR
jgi:hypothetical protein